MGSGVCAGHGFFGDVAERVIFIRYVLPRQPVAFTRKSAAGVSVGYAAVICGYFRYVARRVVFILPIRVLQFWRITVC